MNCDCELPSCEECYPDLHLVNLRAWSGNPDCHEQIIQAFNSGYSIRQIGKEFGMPTTSVFRICCAARNMARAHGNKDTWLRTAKPITERVQ